jgi:hypothetical protein
MRLSDAPRLNRRRPGSLYSIIEYEKTPPPPGFSRLDFETTLDFGLLFIIAGPITKLFEWGEEGE